MTAESIPSFDQIQIHVKETPSRARRHRRWGPVVVAIAILFPFVAVSMIAGTFYVVSMTEPSLDSSNSRSRHQVAPKREARTAKSTVSSPVADVKHRQKPRQKPIILFAADESLTSSDTRVSFGSTQRNTETSHWTAFDASWHAGLFEKSTSAGVNNTIDQVVHDALREQGIEPAKLCSDETFLRRVYLDVLGTLPTADQSLKFINNHSDSKRNDLIEHVLQRPEFADYWAMKWCDVLRVKAEFPINLWPQAAQAYHRWIRTAIASDMPYDQFARELLTASGSNFRVPQVNFYRALQSHEPKAIAQVVALTFMGERAENWPTERLDGMSQFFGRVGFKPTGEWKEEIVFFDRRRDGKLTNEAVKAVYPSTAAVEIPANQDPRRVFADWLTDDRNSWFARVCANRVWCWLNGRGILEPVDDVRVDNRPSNPKLLDHLAEELVAADYDVKQLIRVILQSSTYQQSCVARDKKPLADEHFAFYQPRRLDAEVLIDAICQITGTTETYMSIIPEPFTFLPKNQRAIALPDGSITSSFLETFGRPSRDTGLASERNNRLTAGQALHLLNSNHIRDKFKQGGGIKELVRRSNDRFETVDLLYLTILSRRATEGELTIGGPLCESNSGAQDLAWALVNSDEFLFRH